ncbi:MAG: hypothetical protein WCK74_04220 [Gemmatimonadaceae bacterium]
MAGAVLLMAGPLQAQPRGEGPLILRLPASARSAALGTLGLSITDADALFANPAMLPSVRGTAISVHRYGGAATAGSMATTATVGPVTLGIGAQTLQYQAAAGASYADVVAAGATHLADGGPVAAASTAFTIGAARTLGSWKVGASVKVLDERLGAQHDGTLAVDLGGQRTLGPGVLAVVAHNLGVGPRIGGVTGTLPRRLGVGYGLSRPIAPAWDLGGQMALTMEGDWFVRPAGGAELTYVPIDGVALTVRSGVRLPRERDESLVTGGLGVQIDHLLIDYALEPMRGGRPASHRIGIRLR